MAKTYIPTLIRILRKVCVYITRYRAQLERFLPEGGSAALDAVVIACEAFLEFAGENPT